MGINKIKLGILTIMLGLTANAQNYDFTYDAYETQLQMKPISTQQYITFGATAVGGGLIAKFVEEQTDRKWVGILASVAFGAMAGIIIDDNDRRSLPNYSLKNTPQAYNDTVAGALGGFVGSVAINIPIFNGRGNSKRGFNGRYKSRKRR